MSMFNINLIILSVIVLSINGLTLIKEPEDQFVRLYTDVVFNCQIDGYNPDNDLIEWCKNDFCTWGRLKGSSSDDKLQYKSLPKYFIIGDRTRGEWNLLIQNVTEREAGNYSCTLTRKNTPNFKKIQTRTATLSIMEKPRLIEFDNSKPIDVIFNKYTTFDCKVYRGVPDPTFIWKLVDNRDGLVTVLQNSALKKESFNGSFLYTSSVGIQGAFDVQNKNLVCEVQHPMLEQPRNNLKLSRAVEINFKYAPILSLSTKPSNNLIEDETYTFSCKSSAVPISLDTILKLVNDKTEVFNYHTSINGELTVRMTREMNGMTVVCESENEVGRTSINQTLNVSYPPRFVEESPKLVALNDSQKAVRLKCSVDSNPVAPVTWYNENSEKIQIGSELEISINQTSLVDHHTSSYTRIYGRFRCQAATSGYNAIQRETVLVRNGIPTITGKTLYLTETNAELDLQFSVLSSPDFSANPVCTKLSIDKEINLRQTFKPVNTDLNRYVFSKVYTDNGNKIASEISFKIKSISEEDFGVYNCTVFNSYGTNSFIFEVQAKENDNKFIIALSASIFFLVLFLSLIIAIIIIALHLKFKERKKKKESLKGVFDYSSSAKNSPNLSVSEWITNNSLNTEESKQDKLSQCEIFFDGKTLNTFTDSILIYPTRQSNQSSVNSENHLIDVRANESSVVDLRSESNHAYITNDLNRFYQDMSIFSVPNYQSQSVLLSKFQTNV